jgi:hypothetical protein
MMYGGEEQEGLGASDKDSDTGGLALQRLAGLDAQWAVNIGKDEPSRRRYDGDGRGRET